MKRSSSPPSHTPHAAAWSGSTRPEEKKRFELSARDVLLGLLLLIAVLLAYHPAWRGTLLWDDERHLTSPELSSWAGLIRIWADPRATAEYYPLEHTFFWVEHRIFGDATFGPHVVNLVLHALNAFGVGLILRRLGVRAGWWCAWIFALHPVMAESAAWITELKNTLSTAFVLLAAYWYLNYDENRRGGSYWIAGACFMLSLLSKSATVTFPAALLVIFWWQRGRLRWRTDVLPLLPFFALSLAAGLVTLWVEGTITGANDHASVLTLVQRTFLAAHQIGFYVEKLFWPHPLVFVYPLWSPEEISHQGPAWLAAVLLMTGGLWKIRTWRRGPLAGWLFFVGTLFPSSGFFNLYMFRFSYVADHLQYLACLGVIVPVVAGLQEGSETLTAATRRWLILPALAIVGVLATLTWRQAHLYRNAVVMYEEVLRQNPSCWLAHTNLGAILEQTSPAEAEPHLRATIRLNPLYAPGFFNLADHEFRADQADQAIAHYRESIRLDPSFAPAHGNLGLLLAQTGKKDAAIEELKQSLALQPKVPDLINQLGSLLLSEHHDKEAEEEFRQALRLRPDWSEAHANLAVALAHLGQADQALAEFRTALETKPLGALAYSNLGDNFLLLHSAEDAERSYQAALRVDPQFAPAHTSLGVLYAREGKFALALEHHRAVVRQHPESGEAHFNLAVTLLHAGQNADGLAELHAAADCQPPSRPAQRALDKIAGREGEH